MEKIASARKTPIVRDWIYVAKDAEEVDRIVRNGFVCQKDDSDDRNLLGNEVNSGSINPPRDSSKTHEKGPLNTASSWSNTPTSLYYLTILEKQLRSISCWSGYV